MVQGHTGIGYCPHFETSPSNTFSNSLYPRRTSVFLPRMWVRRTCRAYLVLMLCQNNLFFRLFRWPKNSLRSQLCHSSQAFCDHSSWSSSFPYSLFFPSPVLFSSEHSSLPETLTHVFVGVYLLSVSHVRERMSRESGDLGSHGHLCSPAV